MIVLLISGLALLAVGGLLSAISAALVSGLRLQSIGASAVGVAGFWALAEGGAYGASFTSALTPRFGVDGLTGLFLGTLGLIAAPAVAFASAYLHSTPKGRSTGLLGAAFILSLVGVLCSRDVITFLVFWELMTLTPAAIILINRNDAVGRRSVFTYVAITHIGGAGTWIALLLLAHAGAIGDSAALIEGSGLQAVIAITAIIGFGTKAGLVPMHAWLPRTHPIAPAHISALMSAVMIAVAAYGLIRVLVEWLGDAPAWVGIAMLALGAVSAVMGITYALFQRDLKRLLAYSSVEHMGMISLGLGAYLVLRSSGASVWAAFALAAALLHVLNHAVFKALLFLAAGAFEQAVGTLELDHLGGLLRRMPWTGGAFLIGALAIAGVPLLNGFASEWLLLQSLLHVTADSGPWLGVAGVIALVALVGTLALAALCFVKVIGLVLLGLPRRAVSAQATEAKPAMRGAIVALAVVCVVLGAVPGVVFPLLVALAPGAVATPTHAGLWLPDTGNLPTLSLLLVVLAIGSLVWFARGNRRAASAPTWASGQPIEATLNWTSAGFTKPLRLVLEVVLRPEREIVVHARGGIVQSVSYTGRVPNLIDEKLYRPVVQQALAGAALARRLQSGRLGLYVAYLIGLVVVLLIAVRIGVIG